MVPIRQPTRRIKESWVRGIVSAEQLRSMNLNPCSVMMVCEAKRMLTQQRREYARLIRQNTKQNER